MKKRIMQKWVKALRSGEYKQTTYRLIDDDGFCCLGVLCDIATKEGIITLDIWQSGSRLPVEVMKWADISHHYGAYNKSAYNLADLNDNGKSFKYISSIIEKKYAKL